MSDRTIAPDRPAPKAHAPTLGTAESPTPESPATPGSTDEVAAIPVSELSATSPTPQVRLERLFSLGPTVGAEGAESADEGRPTVLHELLLLLARELQERGSSDDSGALSTQLALLIWDGLGRADAALPLLKGSGHPVAHALRLQAALDDPQPEAALRNLIVQLRPGAPPQDLAELGELLLFAASAGTSGAATVLDAYALSAELLAKGGEPRLRALSLTLLGKPAAAASALETSEDGNDLLWAADLLLLGLPSVLAPSRGDSPALKAALVPALSLLDRVLSSPPVSDGGSAGMAAAYATFSALERVLGLAQDPRFGLRARRGELLRRRLDFFGGLAALQDSGSDAAQVAGRPSRVELLGTALQLAAWLAETGDSQSESEAVALYTTISAFCARHRESSAAVGRYLGLLEAARLQLRRGEHIAAAEHYQTLAYFLIELAGGRQGVAALKSADPAGDAASGIQLEWRAISAALSYFGRAAELLERDSHNTTSALRAATLLGRVAEFGCLHESHTLRRLRTLLAAGHDGQAEAISALVRLADHASEQADGGQALRLAARAARATEALRIPGGDAYELRPGPLPTSTSLPSMRRDLLALARRCRRRGDHPQLVELYRRLSLRPTHQPSDTAVMEQAAAASLYSALATALSLNLTDDQQVTPALLDLQHTADAWAQLASTSSSGPGRSLLTDATRFLLRQRQGFEGQAAQQAAEALNTLLAQVRSADTQAHLLRQLGHHASEMTADFALAERSYQQVLQRRPRDVMALHALARLAQQRDEPERAIQLLQQAVEAALQGGPTQLPPLPTALQPLAGSLPSRLSPPQSGAGETQVGTQAAALLCCELGTLYEHLAHMQTEHTGAIDQAVACYSEALRRDPQCRTAARALVTLYRSMSRPREQLGAMDRLLPLLRDDAQRLSLLLEIGDLAMQLAAAPSAQSDATPTGDTDAQGQVFAEQALAAYSQAISLSPSQPQAIARFIELSRRLRRFARMAEVLKAAPRTPEVLAALELAYGELGDPQALATALEEQLGQLIVAADIPRPRVAQITRSLAELYQRLHRSEDEARAWERLYEIAPDELLSNIPALLLLEKRYGQSGRHTEQATLLGRAIERLSHEQAQLQGAGLEQQLELRERRRQLLLRLGDVQRDYLGAQAQAVATFEQVLSEWPKEPSALRALVSLYGGGATSASAPSSPEKQAEQRRVLSLLFEAASEPAERSRIMFQLGELDEKQGNQEEALRHYGQAFFLDPANRPAFTSYERLCYLRKQWNEAIRMYDAALKLIDTQKTRSYRPADLHLRRGQVLLTYLQQPDEALPSYLRALETDAENDNTQATLENIYAGRSQWRELLTVYEKRASLVREDVKRVEILRRAAKVATAKLRDINEAVRYYEKLHAVDPTDSDALDALESHYERSRDNEKLYNLLSTRVALSVDEQQIIALNMRIGTLCEEGLRDHDRAISAYRHVIEVQPTHREALDAMARLFEANERWAELIDVTRRQIRLVTDRAQKALLYFKCGSVTEAKFGKEDDAIRYYEAAVRTSAACLPALHSLRDIYIRREDWTRVTQTLELESKLWTEEKERAGILAHIGQIFQERLGNHARAIEFYEQALSVDKDSMPANRALFAMYFARGEWERALAASQVLLQKASREGEPSERSEFQRKRAIVALRLGQVRTACDSVAAALDVYPENLPVLELMASLASRRHLPYDFGPLARELEKQYRRRDLPHCLARVLCAQAAMLHPGNDIEAVEALLQEAVRLSPHDYLPCAALAGYYERLRRFSQARATLEQFAAQSIPPSGEAGAGELRARALLRLADVWSTSLMDSDRAQGILHGLVHGEAPVPAHLRREARFRLAQELYVQSRFEQARGEIEKLISDTESAEFGITAPELGTPNTQRSSAAEDLARFHYYLGRILDALHEDGPAELAYRRTIDLVPTFAPAVVALARRAVKAGERAQAEILLRDAIAQLGAAGSRHEADANEEAHRLRRAICRLLAGINPQQAAEAYRQTISLATQQVPAESLRSSSLLEDSEEPRAAWETLEDRIALAELLFRKLNDTVAARAEILRVLARDLRSASAYPLLSEIYEAGSQPARGERVRTVFTLLGYADQPLAEKRSTPRVLAIRQAISDEQRERCLLPRAVLGSPHFDLLLALSEAPVLSRLFPTPWPLTLEGDREPQPANRLWDPAFKLAIADAQRLFGIEVDVYFATPLPGYVLALEAPQPGAKPIVVLDSGILGSPDGERRFLLGRAIESLRSRYAFLLRMTATEQQAWLRLAQTLLTPAAQQETAARELVAQLSPAGQARLERAAERMATASAHPGTLPAAALDPLQFLHTLPFLADRAGLVFCDDIAAAVRVLLRIHGEDPALGGEPTPDAPVIGGSGRGQGGILLGQVPGGAELARYYLSDNYQDLLSAIRDTSRL